MDNSNKIFCSEEFIRWRLFRTSELNLKWNEFRRNNPHLNDELDKAIEQFDAVRFNEYSFPREDKEKLFSDIMNKVQSYNKRQRLRHIYFSVASVLVFGIIASFFHFFLNNTVVDVRQDEYVIGEALPGEEVYILSGNSKVSLANNSSIKIADGSKITITDSANIRKEIALESDAVMNKLVVPYGRRSELTLADGSKLILNAGTQVDFPSGFKGKTREISVKGEIYIDVVANKLMPFIVHTSKMDVQVLGTSFNVSAYDNDFPNVVLVSGSVKVKADDNLAELKPNQKAEFAEGNLTIENVNVSEYISWTRDVLEFNETPVSEILKKVGRYYNVQFENISDAYLNRQTCSGKLYLSSNLDSVMISMSALTSTRYFRNNNNIHIKKR